MVGQVIGPLLRWHVQVHPFRWHFIFAQENASENMNEMESKKCHIKVTYNHNCHV